MAALALEKVENVTQVLKLKQALPRVYSAFVSLLPNRGGLAERGCEVLSEEQ